MAITLCNDTLKKTEMHLCPAFAGVMKQRLNHEAELNSGVYVS